MEALTRKAFHLPSYFVCQLMEFSAVIWEEFFDHKELAVALIFLAKISHSELRLADAFTKILMFVAA